MEILCDDVISKIAILLEMEDITDFADCNERINKIIDNDIFWQQKYIHDFGNEYIKNIICWKEAYINYGKTYSVGDNDRGQLGLGNFDPKFVPTLMSNIRTKNIMNTGSYCMMIDFNDDVYSFGNNNQYGQLGLGDLDDRLSPTKIGNIKAKYIFCRYNRSYIIDFNDDAWTFGYNKNWLLGLSTDDYANPSPCKIPNIKVLQIACGWIHTIIIDTNFEVYSFGNNSDGQLGLGDNIFRANRTKIPNIKAKYVSCGFEHTILIGLDDKMYGFGNNNYGQLALNSDKVYTPTLISDIKIKSIDCSLGYNFFIDLEDNLYAFGCNKRLIFKDYQINKNPVQILGIKAKSIVLGFGSSPIIIDLDGYMYIVDYMEKHQIYNEYEVEQFNNSSIYKILNHKVKSATYTNRSMFLIK